MFYVYRVGALLTRSREPDIDGWCLHGLCPNTLADNDLACSGKEYLGVDIKQKAKLLAASSGAAAAAAFTAENPRPWARPGPTCLPQVRSFPNSLEFASSEPSASITTSRHVISSAPSFPNRLPPSLSLWQISEPGPETRSALKKRNWGQKTPKNWRILCPAVTILNPAVEQSKRRCAIKNCVLCTTGLKNPWAAGHRTSRRLVAELCGGEHILALSQSGPEPDTHGLLFFVSQLRTTRCTRRPLDPNVVHEKRQSIHHDYFTSHQNLLLTNPRGKKKLQFVCFTCFYYDL